MFRLTLIFLFTPAVLFSQTDCNSTDSLVSGKCVTYYSTGRIEIKGKMKNGKRHGSFTTYYITGQKQSEVKYKNGKMNGTYRSYHMNGSLEKQYFLVDDLIQGDYQEFHDNGYVRVEGQMIDSKKIGFWNYKDPFGKLIESVDFDVVKQE